MQKYRCDNPVNGSIHRQPTKFYQKTNDKMNLKSHDGLLYEFELTEINGDIVSGKYLVHPKQPIKISRYHFDKNFLIANIPDEMFILGIKYFESKGGDAQITVTGKAKKFETIHNAYNRELMEEVGIYINSFDNVTENLIELEHFSVNTIVVNIKNITSIVPTRKNMSTDVNLRVQVCIFGTIDEFEKILSSVTHRINEEIDIEGVVLFPKSVLDCVDV